MIELQQLSNAIKFFVKDFPVGQQVLFVHTTEEGDPVSGSKGIVTGHALVDNIPSAYVQFPNGAKAISACDIEPQQSFVGDVRSLIKID